MSHPARGSVAALLIAMLGLLVPNLVSAADPTDKPNVQNAVPAVDETVDSAQRASVTQPTVSAAQAATRVRQLHGGRVLSVNTSRRGDTVGYKVRVLVDGGRVKTVYVKSGSVRSEDAPGARSSERQRPALRSGVRTIGDG